LAAGRGERLRPLTDGLPKGLIKIDQKSLLQHSLTRLAACGISKAIIVVGFKGAAIEQQLGPSCEGVELAYVQNEKYATTGSMYSLQKARTFINEDIILLESDVIFERAAIEIMRRSKQNSILVAPSRGTGDEVFIRADHEGHLIDLGKHIADKEDTLGELVGISRLSLPFLRQMYRYANVTFARHGTNIAYEDIIMLTVRSGNPNSVDCVFVEDLLWTEIDDERDLRRAKAVLNEIEKREASPESVRNNADRAFKYSSDLRN
jgi:2-aminoethylphosphonate-pyruvate transaminase